jgi:hypothetical protein
VGIDERSGGTPEADDVPRLVAWLRSERPATTGAEVALLLGRVAPDRLLRLERILDDLARGCRPPSPTDLAALGELDDLLARGPSTDVPGPETPDPTLSEGRAP